MPYRKIDPKMNQWIFNNKCKAKSYEELAVLINGEFGTHYTRSSLRPYIIRKFKLNFYPASVNDYTTQQDDWLKSNANSVPYSQLYKKFNEVFGTDRTESAIRNRCYTRLGIRSENPNEFNNKIAWNKAKCGEIRVDSKGVELIGTETGLKPLRRYLYEQKFGKVPEDHQVISLDGTSNVDSLYCIPKKYMMMMNRNHWVFKDKDLTLAAIKLCELCYALSGGKNVTEVKK